MSVLSPSHTTLTLAFSPDTDDAFMIRAIEEGLIDTGPFRFELIAADIQHLNEQAIAGTYDISAISIAAYPLISAHYELVPVGSSIGDQFGPALVVAKKSPIRSPADLAGKRIAVPGLYTSAYYAARMLLGEFVPVPTLFSEITSRVASGDCDGGILIHELQMWDQHPDLVKIGDLGRLWHQTYELPLPLGGNAIRRSLGAEAVAAVTKILKDSIIYGFEHRSTTLQAALKRSGAVVSLKEADRYISMYVNDHSLHFAGPVQKAIGLILRGGANLGLCPPVDLAF